MEYLNHERNELMCGLSSHEMNVTIFLRYTLCLIYMSPILFTFIVDLVRETARRGVLNEMLYGNDVVVMDGTTGFRSRFWKLREVGNSRFW